MTAELNAWSQTLDNEGSFPEDRAGSAQSVMAAGGQCCLAWLLPAHDACALPLNDLLIADHLLGMSRLSITVTHCMRCIL